MQIEEVAFPQEGLCRVVVRETADAYHAAVEQLYQKRRQFYPVQGWPGGDAPLEAIERAYGVDTFRVEAIDHLLLYGFSPLRAKLCAERGLFALTDTEPELLWADENGFAAACTFAVAPPVRLGQYTGFAMADEPSAWNALLARIAAQAGIDPPAYAVRAETEARLEQLRQQLSAQKQSLEQLLGQAKKTQADLEADLQGQVREALAQKILLVQVARSEGLFPTEAELDAEIERMVALSAQNAYARTNPAARQSIADRMALRRALEFLHAHNRPG